MPIYEYTCQACGKELELLVSASAKPTCPSCGSTKLSKKFSTFAAHQGGPALTPCSQGSCPSSTGGGCAGGGCPFA